MTALLTSRLILLLMLVSLSVFASAEFKINANSRGVLLEGYDVVAYFTEGEAVKGKAHWQTEYRGATLYFSSQMHLELFEKEPDHYWPQYNGHCANGLSDGHLVRANPEIFRIIDDRLYLYFSWWGKAQWSFDQDGQIELADKNWLLLGKRP